MGFKKNTERGAAIEMRDVGIADKGIQNVNNTTLQTVDYKGFIVGNNGAEIATITAVGFLSGDSMVGDGFPLTPGQFYPIQGTALQLTSGQVLLILAGVEAP